MNLFLPGKYAGLYDLDFGINKGDNVLDVGGGNKPYPLSTHVADFKDHKEQRHTRELKLDGRLLIEGDVSESLKNCPDNFFDFCFSSHTFEHIENLPKALDEISRTCKRGFYSLPGSDFEFFTAHKHYGHVNLCRQIGDTLHFCKRPQNTIIESFAQVYDELWPYPKFNELWEEQYRYIWEIRYVWSGEIKYKFYEDGSELFPQLKYFKDQK